ncbi:Atg39p NDAI_0H00390 [Naumovozyma dairenensis CBS 421]|uniref:Uncharacterized protein n=1 Tax=Naumovozyma dairenensis (strain ATCC 10597 / BCRC 20456 / CBS 421 / NBRC 0211 / NRRL Y-12639) TaxID=1071378 RepID=G0WEK2_NAUDC|nr:hypothetical protein NDAI_0H00390 [Naumovozyma dairenensis CBS 421]CCD26213.1 hypothetical protein NDAI_0H00390 [Naumovozyma dairenensis CBS 421]
MSAFSFSSSDSEIGEKWVPDAVQGKHNGNDHPDHSDSDGQLSDKWNMIDVDIKEGVGSNDDDKMKAFRVTSAESTSECLQYNDNYDSLSPTSSHSRSEYSSSASDSGSASEPSSSDTVSSSNSSAVLLELSSMSNENDADILSNTSSDDSSSIAVSNTAFNNNINNGNNKENGPNFIEKLSTSRDTLVNPMNNNAERNTNRMGGAIAVKPTSSKNNRPNYGVSDLLELSSPPTYQHLFQPNTNKSQHLNSPGFGTALDSTFCSPSDISLRFNSYLGGQPIGSTAYYESINAPSMAKMGTEYKPPLLGKSRESTCCSPSLTKTGLGYDQPYLPTKNSVSQNSKFTTYGNDNEKYSSMHKITERQIRYEKDKRDKKIFCLTALVYLLGFILSYIIIFKYFEVTLFRMFNKNNDNTNNNNNDLFKLTKSNKVWSSTNGKYFVDFDKKYAYRVNNENDLKNHWFKMKILWYETKLKIMDQNTLNSMLQNCQNFGNKLSIKAMESYNFFKLYGIKTNKIISKSMKDYYNKQLNPFYQSSNKIVRRFFKIHYKAMETYSVKMYKLMNKSLESTIKYQLKPFYLSMSKLVTKNYKPLLWKKIL